MSALQGWLASGLMAVTLVTAAVRKVDEEKEPPLLLSLEVGGKSVPIEIDKPLELDLNGGKTKVTLRAKPYRVFDFAGIRFRYPRHLSFEADTSDYPSTIWTLDGNDAVISVQRCVGLDDHESLRRSISDGLVEDYGASKARQKTTSITLGKRTLSGTTLDLTIVGSRMTQSFYSFQSGDSVFILTFQDMLKDNGDPTDEAVRAFKMMRETFEFPKKGK